MARLSKDRPRKSDKPIVPSVELKCMFISKAVTFANCHRKFYWTYVRNMVPKAIRMPFWVGDVYHVGLEWFFKGMSPSEVLKKIDKYMEDTLKDHFVPPDKMPEIDRMKAVIPAMLKSFFHVMAKRVSQWKIKHAELPFAVNLEKDNFMLVPFVGKVDLVFEEKGVLCVVEHKTSAQPTSDYFDRLPFDLQVMCYPVGVRESTGLTIKKVIYNVVRKSALRQKKNETFKEFLNRLVNDYVERDDFYFHVKDILYNKKHVDAAMADLIRITEEIWTYYDALGKEGVLKKEEWYRNSDYCFRWGRCPYYFLCRYGEKTNMMRLFKQRELRYEEEHKETREKVGNTIGKKASKRKAVKK